MGILLPNNLPYSVTCCRTLERNCCWIESRCFKVINYKTGTKPRHAYSAVIVVRIYSSSSENVTLGIYQHPSTTVLHDLVKVLARMQYIIQQNTENLNQFYEINLTFDIT